MDKETGDKIREMYRRGCGDRRIAKELDLTVKEIRRYRRIHKIKTTMSINRCGKLIEELARKGETSSSIMKIVGCTEKVVTRVKKEKGIRSINSPIYTEKSAIIKLMYEKGMNDVEIGKALNCVASVIFKWRKAKGLAPNVKKFDREKRFEQIKKLYDKGYNDSHIVEELHCCFKTVEKWRKSMNLLPNKESRKKKTL